MTLSSRNGMSRQQGVALLEVLISVLILGIGLLGIAAMQSMALRNSQSSYEHSQAVIQAYSILDAMRANRARAIAGDYNQGTPLCTVPAAAGTQVSIDMNSWMTALKQSMGAVTDTTTCASVDCQSSGYCIVRVQWDDSRATNAGPGGATQAGQVAEAVEMRTTL